MIYIKMTQRKQILLSTDGRNQGKVRRRIGLSSMEGGIKGHEKLYTIAFFLKYIYTSPIKGKGKHFFFRVN